MDKMLHPKALNHNSGLVFKNSIGHLLVHNYLKLFTLTIPSNLFHHIQNVLPSLSDKFK
jgi:hypothetical protein